MTRRKIIFINIENAYETPEFNGDKEEFEKFGSADWCDKNWSEIETEFKNVKTLEEFKAASIRAQEYYHSSIAGQSILPVVSVTGKFGKGMELREIAENILIEEY
jgi:hypothetical protein